MAKALLNDAGLRSLKPPERGQVCHWDKNLPGFGIRISQGGTKTFVLNRKNSFITIGRFPTISLSEARTEAKRLLAEFTLGKVRPQSITYATAVKLFLDDKTGSARESTIESYKGLLTRLNFQGQLTEITHDEIERKLARRSNYNHYLVALKVFFNWAVKRRYVSENPTIPFSKETVTPRSRVLSDEELGKIWRACEQRGSDGGVPTRSDACTSARTTLPINFATIVKLLILTGQRKNEIASLQFSWMTKTDTLHNSTKKKSTSIAMSVTQTGANSFSNVATGASTIQSTDLWTITIPAEVAKNGREHTFPIGTLACSLLKLQTQSGREVSTLLFPARGSTSVPFNGWSKSKAALDKASGVTDWTLHDLRRTFATNLARLGTPIHVVEKLLNHSSGTISGVAAVYNRHQFWDEQVEAIEKYDRFLQSLFASTQPLGGRSHGAADHGKGTGDTK